MNNSETIKIIAAALVKAQSEMGNAVKDSTNPFFKSKYADLNSVREASLPILNSHGISVIQPTTVIHGVNYVETILLHESGEWISSLTQIIAAKINDAQSHGSGLSYARRYALSSICNIGAEDDDGNAAVTPATKGKEAKKKKKKQDDNYLVFWQESINACKTENDLTALWEGNKETCKNDADIISMFKKRKAAIVKK